MPSIREHLDTLREASMFRSIPSASTGEILDLSGNDYLGLALRAEEFREEFHDRFGMASFTSSASRLLSSRQDIHLGYEAMLGSLYGKEALLFNSGYHANMGCVGALTLPGTLFVCDKLMHASFIDGLQAARSEYVRFPHNDVGRLRKILGRDSGKHERIVVAVEAIYSMDGDEAPLREISAMKAEFPEMLLYVDEAHSFGVRGDKGLGLCEELGVVSYADIIIGTLGKALASSGAFAICNREIKELLVNRARSFIFSTALPPVNVAWSMLMTEKVLEMKSERESLRGVSEWFSKKLEEMSGRKTGSSSQIVPYLTGNAETALRLARALAEGGIRALPIRRPTVPPGGERIRFSLYSGLQPSDLRPVMEVLLQNDKAV